LCNRPQLSGIERGCGFSIVIDKVPWHTYGTLWNWQQRLSHFFYGLRQAFFSCPTIDIYRQLWRGMPRQGLCFFDAHPAFNDEIDVGDATGMKIQFACRCDLRDAGGLQALIELTGGMRRDIEEWIAWQV
jgi:hypothetical protein